MRRTSAAGVQDALRKAFVSKGSGLPIYFMGLGLGSSDFQVLEFRDLG